MAAAWVKAFRGSAGEALWARAGGGGCSGYWTGRRKRRRRGYRGRKAGALYRRLRHRVRLHRQIDDPRSDQCPAHKGRYKLPIHAKALKAYKRTRTRLRFVTQTLKWVKNAVSKRA